MNQIRTTTEHLTEATIERLDRDLAEAVRRIAAGDAAKAQCGLTFTVSHDPEEDEIVVDYAHKAASAQKGSFTVDRGSQPRLAFEAEGEAGERPHPALTVH
jgi:hypothetical protein